MPMPLVPGGSKNVEGGLFVPHLPVYNNWKVAFGGSVRGFIFTC